MYEERVHPVYHTLQSGLIHADFHDCNIIIEKDSNILNIVDFNDLRRAPFVVELAIMSIDFLKDLTGSIKEQIDPVIKGYCQHNPLPQVELDLLMYVIIGRLTQAIILCMQAAARDPTNVDYIMEKLDDHELLLNSLLHLYA